ncbi:hypothetical protein PTI98_008704 [Pleurotus ostreatus]|nr:hypothetical protein PTI98_008704 [Pleurotus ostreatus]
MSPTLTPHLAAVLHGPADIRLEHRTLFRPARGAARIRILATGLCGSDLHYFADARNGDFAVRAPLVLGHEAVGEVEAAGAGAVDAYGRQLQVGTRVAIEPGVPCCIDTAGNSSGAGAASSASAKSCTHCASGRYNLCKDLRFASSAKTFPHLDGTLQEKMLHPAALLWPPPRPGARSSSSAWARANITLPLSAAALREVDILGSFPLCAHVRGGAAPAWCVCGASAEGEDVVYHPRYLSLLHPTVLHAASPEGSTTTTASIATSKSSGVEGQAQAQAQGERVGEAELVGEAEGAARWPAAPRRTLPDLTRLITHTFPLADTQKAFEMMRAGVDAAGGMVMKVVIQ